jgi:FkbM family methyltransferase
MGKVSWILGIAKRVYRRLERRMYSGGATKYLLESLLTRHVNTGDNKIKVPPKASSVEVSEMMEIIPISSYGGCIWDIGAHIGHFSIEVSRTFDKVIAFEPSAENYGYLKDNIERNEIDNINPLNIAVGDEDGESVMFVDPRPGSGIHSLSKDKMLKKEERVNVMTIDSLMEVYETPKVIKIDVEGAELDVIRGAKKTIRNKNVEWLIEVHSERTGKRRDRIGQHGGKVEELYDILKRNNYSLYGSKEGKCLEIEIEKDNLPLYWFASKKNGI